MEHPGAFRNYVVGTLAGVGSARWVSMQLRLDPDVQDWARSPSISLHSMSAKIVSMAAVRRLD